ncbi:MAG: hypothetical protein IKB98_04490 [Clostridia bacterium]|nr:hypothetical protein [Clostridia bacterium]
MSKIIEEMARDIRPVLTDRVDIGFIPDLDKPIAKTLVKLGYRKVSEDSILLSKTDFDLILPPNRVVLSIEEYEGLVRSTSYISKGTAEKIFAKIDEALCECTIVHNGGDYGWKLQGYERNDLTERLTKIAEQFGTSIEEYKKAAYRDHLLLENYYGNAKEQTEKVQAAQKEEE